MKGHLNVLIPKQPEIQAQTLALVYEGYCDYWSFNLNLSIHLHTIKYHSLLS